MLRGLNAENEELCAELETLRKERDHLAEERDKAWHLVASLRRKAAV